MEKSKAFFPDRDAKILRRDIKNSIAHLERLVGFDRDGRLNALAVHRSAIPRFQIFQNETCLRPGQLAMPARRLGILDHNVAFRSASDDDRLPALKAGGQWVTRIASSRLRRLGQAARFICHNDILIALASGASSLRKGGHLGMFVSSDDRVGSGQPGAPAHRTMCQAREGPSKFVWKDIP